MQREIQSRTRKSFHKDLRDTILAQIGAGKLTEDMELSSVLDSLETVQLTMEIEELGGPTVPIKSVGDLLWLFKAIDLKREQKHRRKQHSD
jgi:acyl carrier protein